MNPAKQEKLGWLLEGTGLQGVNPGELPDWQRLAPISEEGPTHLENAQAKARRWSHRAGMMAIASDGGLVIPALGEGWEPLLTRRFAGEAATDRERLDRLLELMRPYTGGQRAAYWTEALAVARGGHVLKSWQAESQRGLLAASYDPSTIRVGFWAFSLWYLPQFGKCHSQLSAEELEQADDHWTRLRALVRAFFQSEGVLD